MSVVPPPGSLTVGGGTSGSNPLPHKHMPDIPQSPQLPWQYGDNRLILLVRDPRTLFAAWEVTTDGLGRNGGTPFSLRILERDGTGGSTICLEVGVSGKESTYIFHDRPGSTLWAELGLGEGENFRSLLKSLPVRTPTGRESDLIDANWTTIDEVLERSRHGQYQGGASTFR